MNGLEQLGYFGNGPHNVDAYVIQNMIGYLLVIRFSRNKTEKCLLRKYPNSG